MFLWVKIGGSPASGLSIFDPLDSSDFFIENSEIALFEAFTTLLQSG